MELKNFTVYWSVILVFIFYGYGAANYGVEYSDLEILGASCYPKDTCISAALPFENRTCECDSLCWKYDDCCIDANRNSQSNSVNSDVQLKCTKYAEDLGVYAVTRCPSSYQGPEEVRRYCENENDIRNPMANSPATDITRNITYKNHYCAQCNAVNPRNMRSWDIQIKCLDLDNDTLVAVNSTYVKNHLSFVESETYESPWGFYYPENSDDIHDFYRCEVPFRPPESLRPFVRLCRPNTISTCARNYPRRVHIRKCRAFTAVVYINQKFYKNPYCAMCNNENVVNKACIVPSDIMKRDNKKPALSFTVLMDVNMSDGNLVGQTVDNRCPRNQKYDPFAKKCRTLVCAVPGYKVVNGECRKP